MRSLKILVLIAASLTLSACGNNSSGAGTSLIVGINTMNLVGGNAGTTGGKGGTISIDSFTDVRFNPNGAIPLTFTVPTTLSIFGDVPLTVSATTTVKLSTDPSLAVGDLFVILDGDNRLHQVTDASTNPVVSVVITGLTISPGGRLILPVNDSVNNRAHVVFDNAVEIDGTLTVATAGTGLFIEAGHAQGDENRSIFRVGSGGNVLNAGGNIYLFSWGMLINLGDIDSSGADGANGANGQDAGYIELESYGNLYNSGNVTAKGGGGGSAAGGKGNRIAMMAFNGSLYNGRDRGVGGKGTTGGNLDNSGGNGATGGDGGQILVSSGGGTPLEGFVVPTSMGRSLIAGSLVSDGGDATAGNGGNGAAYSSLPGPAGIALQSQSSGPLSVSGRISSKGGAGGANSTGGTGGDLTLHQHFGKDMANEAAIEGIKLGANVNLSGGAGVLTGGDAGTLTITNNIGTDAYPPNPKGSKVAILPMVQLIGYFNIQLSGGDANTGGAGGSCKIYTHSSVIASLVYPAPGIRNAVPIHANGGNATKTVSGSKGGVGGSFDWQVGGGDANNVAFDEKISLIDSKAAIHVSGGDGDTGGNGGDIFFHGYALKNIGAISGKGGDGTARGGDGSVNRIELHATQTLTNNASIVASGGTGVIAGGNGGNNVYLVAKWVNNIGMILAAGGTGKDRGAGGLINLESHSRNTRNSGQLNVSGNPIGRIIIDLVERKVPPTGIFTGIM